MISQWVYFREDTAEPVTTPYELSELSVLPATKPEFFIENLWSIRYDSGDSGVDHHSEKIHMGPAWRNREIKNNLQASAQANNRQASRSISNAVDI